MQRRLRPNCGHWGGWTHLVRLDGTGYSVNPGERRQLDVLSTIPQADAKGAIVIELAQKWKCHSRAQATLRGT
jgi:hypothetical protein